MLRRLQNIDVTNKRVLVRFDLNVPIDDRGNLTETTRLERVKPTVDCLRGHGARIVVMAHLGRPRGWGDSYLSLKQIVHACGVAWGCSVSFAHDVVGAAAVDAIEKLNNGDVLLLENIRFEAGEEANDPAFVKALAALGDVYVNDAFSVSHRAHASTEGLACLLPSAAGLSMQAELDALAAAVETPKRPVVAVIGGSKVSTKLAVLEHLVTRMDALVIGGGMANTFLMAQGHDIGASLAEPDLVPTARRVMAKAGEAGCRIILPVDVAAAQDFDGDVYRGALSGMPLGYKIFDVGTASIAALESEVARANTIVWNGPLGVFEKPPFDAGTVALARAIAAQVKTRGMVAVAGGGDTLAAVEHAGLNEADFTYLSTAGGAFLEWLEGKELPGVRALMG